MDGGVDIGGELEIYFIDILLEFDSGFLLDVKSMVDVVFMSDNGSELDVEFLFD